MSAITIRTEDADKILEYLRKNLERENKAYKECVENVNKLLKADLNNTSRMFGEVGLGFVNKTHSDTVSKLTEFITILTVGSAESRLNNC